MLLFSICSWGSFVTAISAIQKTFLRFWLTKCRSWKSDV
jgi:hypothetical protein